MILRISLLGYFLKVLSYWNLNACPDFIAWSPIKLKVLSYWNLNAVSANAIVITNQLKVLSYWNLNGISISGAKNRSKP